MIPHLTFLSEWTYANWGHPDDLKSNLEAKVKVENKNDWNMFSLTLISTKNIPVCKKLAFLSKNKKLHKGAPCEEYQTGPLN